MRLSAFADLVLLAVVFWSVWSLRFLNVETAGLLAMIAGVGAGALLLSLRKERWRDIGLKSGGGVLWTLARAGEFCIITLLVGALGIGVATALGFPPSEPAAVADQPDALPAFILDILFGVWIGAALGEEIFFRGFLLSKFRSLFGGGRIALGFAMLAQAVWFGAGHASQGLSGMIVTGSIGFVLALFFVTRARGSLIPMIIGHGVANTLLFTLAYVT